MTRIHKVAGLLLALSAFAATGKAQDSVSADRVVLEAILQAPPEQDTHGDGFLDNVEYLAGTDAHDPNSFLGMYPGNPLAGTTGLVVMWTSEERKEYSLFRATNLFAGFLFALDTNIPAVLPINTYTDSTAVGEGPYYYKVRVNRTGR